MKRAIKTHSSDFVAIMVLLVLSIAVAGYVLSHERLRFPFIQSSPFKLKAEFSTAQAVTPGQGQTIRVSGVQVGDIGQIKLENGTATVEMDINQKYKGLIHQDATALLRPKTGLKDMFIEVTPGHGPVAKEGDTIPVSNTLPDVNLDEIFSSLDADTRAYLDLLVNGAGQGLNNKGNQLAQVLERFEPTHRDLARLNTAVAARGANLRRLVNSLARLNTALGQRRTQLTQLVDSSSQVFRAFASQDQNISRAVADLPGTLRQATATLGKVTTFANVLGPTTHNLIPAARNLQPANVALQQLAIGNKDLTGADLQKALPIGVNCAAGSACSIVKNQIRPFVIAARPLVRNLRPAAVNLAQATPNLRKVFGVLNHLTNMLGYSPGGAQHGYLFWLAWLNHNARTLFSSQDANGDFRPLFLQASCATFAQLVNGNPLADPVLGVTSVLKKTGLCP